MFSMFRNVLNVQNVLIVQNVLNVQKCSQCSKCSHCSKFSHCSKDSHISKNLSMFKNVFNIVVPFTCFVCFIVCFLRISSYSFYFLPHAACGGAIVVLLCWVGLCTVDPAYNPWSIHCKDAAVPDSNFRWAKNTTTP